MNPTPDPRRARLEELLGVEATQGLSSAEANELDTLLSIFPDEDPNGFELAAAAVHLAFSEPPEEIPTHLVEKLHLAAIAFTPVSSLRSSPRSTAWLTWTGWVVAASLAAVLVYTNWPKREPSFAELRHKVQNDPTAKAATFAGDKKNVSGHIVWSDAKQEGYLEVRGLPPLDAAAGTYQLWIVDGGRSTDSFPVDGGVFQVNVDGTALVRIRAPIQVKSAAAFAITREEAGGVVKTNKQPEEWELVLAKKG